MNQRILFAATLLGVALATPPAARAQGAPIDRRIAATFDAPSARRIARILDSVAADGLPTEPVVLRSLEGAAKGAPVDLIVQVLGRLHGDLRMARAVLGPEAGSTELATAAAALQLGVSQDQLAELHGMRGKRSLTAPLGAYLDLVQRGGPRDQSWNTVRDMIRRGAKDAEFARLTPADVGKPNQNPQGNLKPLPGNRPGGGESSS
jgi:hypothetical protein